jgi:hypothetical protein
MSSITKRILFSIIKQAIDENNTLHDLIWYYATQYETADIKGELSRLLDWLCLAESAQKSSIKPVLCSTGKILAKVDHEQVYLWCRYHKEWEPRTFVQLLQGTQPE